MWMTSGACHTKVATVPGAGLHHVEEVLWTALALRTQTREWPKETEPIVARGGKAAAPLRRQLPWNTFSSDQRAVMSRPTTQPFSLPGQYKKYRWGCRCLPVGSNAQTFLDTRIAAQCTKSPGRDAVLPLACDWWNHNPRLWFSFPTSYSELINCHSVFRALRHNKWLIQSTPVLPSA